MIRELIDYSFISWPQFILLTSVVVGLLIVSRRFHLFQKYQWSSSIAYHVFFYMIMSILAVAFILIKPFFHFIFLSIVLGLYYSNIIAYVRGVFSLYYSNVEIGDIISIGDETGKLESLNFGGLHLISNNEKVYFPFNSWKSEKIISMTEKGKAPMFIECLAVDRKDPKQILKLKDILFDFPHLQMNDFDITPQDTYKIRGLLSDNRYYRSLRELLEESGFSIIDNKQ